MPQTVTKTVFAQYCIVQKSGRVNMAHRSGVMQAAKEMALYELVEFIEDGDYSDLLENYGEYTERFDVDV